MERIHLSLKTIYKMLMSNDYPVYSDSVIPEKMRKGQTLLRFWQSMVAEEFYSGSCGGIIWKKDGKRNRYLSALCNRNGERRLYREYIREVSAECSVSTLVKQISKFSEFLSLHEYRHEILLRRVAEVTRILEQDDRLLPEAVIRLFRESAAADALSGVEGEKGRLFQAGYLLTVMMLYAFAGDSVDESTLSVLMTEKMSLACLWESVKSGTGRKAEVIYLTAHSGILQDKSLPRHRFFGRDEALFDIRELAAAQKKCLISGIGGIGKTELLRQLLSMCEEEYLADKIAVVPYHGGLAESFVGAFTNRSRMETEEAFRSILAGIRADADAGIRVLILIDDLNLSSQEDPDLLELGKLPCGILITSRRSSLEGFEVYRLDAPSITTGTLIFRDNYGRPMTREDRELLRQMLKNEEICHPLTLSLMARAAGSHEWSVARLLEHLQAEGKDMIWIEEDHVLRISRIYNQLYSLLKIPEDYRRIAELFTLLPPDSYSEAYLTDIFPGIVGEGLGEKLRILADGGWLDSLSDGYAMHPLVAECLRRKVITEDRLQPLLECLHRRLPALRPVRYDMELTPDETVRIARILISVAGFLSGSISGSLMMDLLNAENLQSLPKATQKTAFDQLTQWRRHCRQWSDLLQVTWCAVVANWSMADPEECAKTFAAQKECLTVPKSLFLDFCGRAGQNMTYEHREKLARDMLTEVLSEDAAPVQKAMAYYNLAGCSHILGSAEEATRWCEQGVAYARTHPECGTLPKFNNLHMLCNMYLKYRKQEQAWSLIQEMEPLLEGNTRPDLRSEYLSILGLYEMTFGDPEKALAYMQEQLAINKECFGMDRDYYLSASMLGNTYIRLNRLEEAVEQYEAAIAYALENKDSRLLQSASNNISVALLKMEHPKDALAHLEIAVSEGRKIGGLMLGESLRNTAIAWGQLGEEEKELAYYREAWPLLLEAYGPEHPRTTAARQRMDELEKK